MISDNRGGLGDIMKSKGVDCGGHMYIDALFMIAGVLYALEAWGILGAFTLSTYLPPWGLLFFLLGLKVYAMHH